MDEECARIVEDMRRLAGAVQSLRASFTSFYSLGMTRFETHGNVFYLRPERIRMEAVVNGKEIVTIRNGPLVQRFAPHGKEVWQYNLKDVPQSLPINFGTLAITDPFVAVDEESLTHDGTRDAGGAKRHAFLARMKAVGSAGSLDTRKGFLLRYEPKAPRISLRLVVDAATGLLLSMTGHDRDGTAVFEALWEPGEINGMMDTSLFRIDALSQGYRIVDMKDIMLSALDPDYADRPPSLN